MNAPEPSTDLRQTLSRAEDVLAVIADRIRRLQTQLATGRAPPEVRNELVQAEEEYLWRADLLRLLARPYPCRSRSRRSTKISSIDTKKEKKHGSESAGSGGAT